MKSPTILIIKMGSTYRKLKSQIGDFDLWIRQSVNNQNIRWKIKSVAQIEPRKIAPFQGIILTGAHATLTQHYQYLDGMKRVIENIIEHKIPTLGICFGHQVINKILGGEVITNPLGPEIGVSKIQLTIDGIIDPIFKELSGGKIKVYSSHVDVVSKIGDGVISLAWNEQTQFQATRYGNFIYTLQFHPEYNKKIMEFYIKQNWSLLKFEHFRNPLYISHPDEILKSSKKIVKSKKILENFIQFIFHLIK